MKKARNAELAKVLKAPMIYGVIEHLVGTALHYFDELGFKSIGFEGGQHIDPQTIDNMESAIWLLLNNLEMVEFANEAFIKTHQNRLTELTQGLPNTVQLMYRHTVYPESDFVMRAGYKNFDTIKAGELLADDRFGPIKAPCDGYILMPLYQKKGEDGFFVVDNC
jgi:succinylglutamate desuccinylase